MFPCHCQSIKKSSNNGNAKHDRKHIHTTESNSSILKSTVSFYIGRYIGYFSSRTIFHIINTFGSDWSNSHKISNLWLSRLAHCAVSQTTFVAMGLGRRIYCLHNTIHPQCAPLYFHKQITAANLGKKLPN
jgi:hypothetical protein